MSHHARSIHDGNLTTLLQNVFETPETWTGNLQIRGCIDLNNGGITEAIDSDADFFGIYAETADGLHIWVEDCDTREQADDLAKYLKTTI